MIREDSLRFAIAVLAAVALIPQTGAQSLPAGSVIHFEVENATLYIYDCPYSDLGTNPNKLDRPLNAKGIAVGFAIGDIVSVNGKAAKGTAYMTTPAGFDGSPNPAPGKPILDGARLSVATWDLDFMNPDGTSIGTIHIDGMNGGLRPPGAPLEFTASAYIVTGGTGPFLGVHGYFQPKQDAATGTRITSACEDPSLRRINAGGLGKRHPVLYLVPLTFPQAIAVTHSKDFTVVSASKPAAAGETLSIFATGLGPTIPGVDPGQPFPAEPLQAVSSPIDVIVNGKPAEVLVAVGYPGAIDAYQVNFRLSSDVGSGSATIQLSAAWIVGPSVKIPIQ